MAEARPSLALPTGGISPGDAAGPGAQQGPREAPSALAAEVLSGWAHQTGGSSQLSSLRAATPPLQNSDTSHRLPDAEQRAANTKPRAELNITVAAHLVNTVHSVHAVEQEPSDKEFVMMELKTFTLCLCKRERIEGLAGKLSCDNSSFHCLLDATAITALFARCPSVMATNKAKRETRTYCGGVQL